MCRPIRTRSPRKLPSGVVRAASDGQRVFDELCGPLSLVKSPLGLEGKMHRACGRGEGDHERIALGFYFVCLELRDLVAKHGMVHPEHVVKAIAIPLPEGGGALDVGEHQADGTDRGVSS